MTVVAALLAGVCLGFLILVVVGMYVPDPPQEPPADDPARPYREALEAAIRIQQTAQDFEQRIYAETASRMATEGSETPGQDKP
jgi:hypothetical protein